VLVAAIPRSVRCERIREIVNVAEHLVGVLELESNDDRELGAPPGSRQAEDAVIGSLLKNPAVIGDPAVQLSSDDFTSPPHRAAYAAAVSPDFA
jgi:hypothetical protein